MHLHVYINKNKIKEVGYEISQNLKVTLFIPKVKQNIAKVKRVMAQKPRLFFKKMVFHSTRYSFHLKRSAFLCKSFSLYRKNIHTAIFYKYRDDQMI